MQVALFGEDAHKEQTKKRLLRGDSYATKGDNKEGKVDRAKKKLIGDDAIGA